MSISDVPMMAAESFASEVRHVQLKAIFLELKALSDGLEEVVDRQTYEEHRKAEFDMPADAEMNVTITAQWERNLNRLTTLCARAHSALIQADVLMHEGP